MTETYSAPIGFAPEASVPPPWSRPPLRAHVDFPLSFNLGHLTYLALGPGWREGQAGKMGEALSASIPLR